MMDTRTKEDMQQSRCNEIGNAPTYNRALRILNRYRKSLEITSQQKVELEKAFRWYWDTATRDRP